MKFNAKMPWKPKYESKKVQILGESKSILCWRYDDLYGRRGDWCRIWESSREWAKRHCKLGISLPVG